MTNTIMNNNKKLSPKFFLSTLAASAAVGLAAGLVGGWLSFVYLKSSVLPAPASNVAIPSERQIFVGEESATIDAVAKVAPSVVSIVIQKDVSRLPRRTTNEFFR